VQAASDRRKLSGDYNSLKAGFAGCSLYRACGRYATVAALPRNDRLGSAVLTLSLRGFKEAVAISGKYREELQLP